MEPKKAKLNTSSMFESLGISLPEKRLSTGDLVNSCRHWIKFDLQKLTGIRERRICSNGEDSYSLAINAALDCLAHSRYTAEDIDVLINCSITKYNSDLNYQFDPPLSFFVKEAIGAKRALYFDVTNACAGMLTGVYILDNYIRRGIIRCGMIVSGEYVSSISDNAAREIRTILSKQLASLTVGDAGAALIMDRAKDGIPGITACELETYAEHSNLCIGKACKNAPGAAMFTEARKLHNVAISLAHPTMLRTLKKSGVSIQDIDWLIPHQTAARAIRAGTRKIGARVGGVPRYVVYNLAEFGNTASTTHFVALYKYLQEQRFRPGDRIQLLAFASGVVIGSVIFTMDELCRKYPRQLQDDAKE
ncbi:MAG: 3-oxoacyl-ACP synthase [Candidatus Aminicenantes bacterium]|nr:3-oxoacyl-ACP synthase [Candidatus Aminicenantes bacterium]NIM82533.1 3-oxoacyl-ACP synthase [Candidatus Aminicenantes bacterium]NIN45669.1 3-oxoacyl-ACP synthase [Candidatus Aminicenantes bacterium]NIN88502.1 3-oxoacyl-ACP synthase [Candidatus Aminicenantes bacterium]NIO84933.1 3-oxoacyl-ACP synthase [Candidatus Aminicenantes bacterium]